MFQMISVAKKRVTQRRAVAMGRIVVGSVAYPLIAEKKLPKGDVLSLAEIAGIMGAKQAPSLIPLCHPLNLDHVGVFTELEPDTLSVRVYCVVSATAKTGVEMEAITGVQVALLTLYDLTKMVEPALEITDTRLLFKEGGKSGTWIHPQGIPAPIAEKLKLAPAKPLPFAWHQVKAAVMTASDRASKGSYTDRSGPLIKEALHMLGATLCDHTILPDEQPLIEAHIRRIVSEQHPHLMILSGGTGLDVRDITPEAVMAVCPRMVPGLAEVLRHDGATDYTRNAWLSRCVVGVLENTLVISLPGSPRAAEEGMAILQDLIPHALHMLNGGKHG